MQIQLNNDKYTSGSPARLDQVKNILTRELKHLAEHLTRVEVHLSDVNSEKSGNNDKRCLLEARPNGLQPIAAEHRADTIDLALSGAAAQLARALESALGKLQDKGKRRDSIKYLEPSQDDA